MQDPYLPMGCSDNDDHFRDDTEPNIDSTHDGEHLLVTPYGPVEWIGCDCCDDMVDKETTSHGFAFSDGTETTACHRCTGEVDDPQTILHGSPWPSSFIEAASFEYEIAHWR